MKLFYRAIIVAAIATVLWFSIYMFMFLSVIDHTTWIREVDSEMRSMIDNPPPDVEIERWNSAVGWTVTMHANLTTTYENVDLEWRDSFLVKLKRRRSGQMSMADIDWIWDEYSVGVKDCQRYMDKWRPEIYR